MKKYCLTQCFKRKISNGLELTIDIILNILIVIAIFIGTIIIGLLLGLLIQVIALFAFDIYIFHVFPLEVGAIFMGGIFVTIMLSIVAYGLISKIYRGIFYVSKNLVMNAIAPEQAECRIFEECKD